MKSTLFFILCLSALTFASCGKDEDPDEYEHNEEHGPEVSFNSPTDGQTISLEAAAAFNVNVGFSAEGDLHEVEVKLSADSAPSDFIIDFDEHTHESNYTFEQVVDLSSYGSGAGFTLKTVTCADHDCEKFEEHSINFNIE